jgi:hypothetical protein
MGHPGAIRSTTARPPGEPQPESSCQWLLSRPHMATRARKGSFHPSRSCCRLLRFLLQKTPTTPRKNEQNKDRSAS